MKGKIELFKENPALGGYSIAVRDDWSFKIKRIHITVDERKAYEEEFKDKILLERDFMEWWIKYKEKEASN